MITYHVERWVDIVDEMRLLWPRHWEEIARDRDVIKLEPDYRSYEAFDQNGALHIVTVRHAGAIVGYHISIVRPHLHYLSSLSAFTDVYYIAPEHRKGWTGWRMFREVERTLRARGVQKIFTGTKIHESPEGRDLDISRLLQREGYVETERLYTKVIGE